MQPFIRLQILGWAGLAKVDGQAYIWMGTPGVPSANLSRATQKSLQVSPGLPPRLQTILIGAAQFTSTRSVFVMTAGSVDLTITFLSPVEVFSDPSVVYPSKI